MKKILITLFVVVALAQWAAPLILIWKSELVLTKGKAFRFETQPVDPEDPLRGRYVSFSFKANAFTIPNNKLERGDEAYVEIDTDKKGYARLKSLGSKPPANGNDYLLVHISYVFNDGNDVVIEYPFEEFYLDEYKAPEAETIYRQSMADTTYNTYALVKVYKGKGVIKDLVINNRPIHSYFK